jgi:hypothetical protein
VVGDPFAASQRACIALWSYLRANILERGVDKPGGRDLPVAAEAASESLKELRTWYHPLSPPGRM